MKTPQTKFSVFLYNRRITSAELASRSGYGVGTIKAWRCGYRTPTRGAKHILAIALSLKPEKLAELFD